MHRIASTAPASAHVRRDDIRQLLVARRNHLLREIHHRVRDVREAGSSGHHATAGVTDAAGTDPEDDLPFALIHLKSEMLARVDEAVRRCDEGTYGFCDDCGASIPSSRLRAIPFALCCRACEEVREADARRLRGPAQRLPPALGGDTFV